MRQTFRPNTTQIPNRFLDFIVQDLTESELKVALYILRRTFGFQKDGDRISLTQLVDGITRKDGSPLDRGTGLSRSSVVRGIKGLEGRGLLQAHRTPGTKRNAPETTFYSLILDHDEGSPKFEPPRSQIEFAGSPNLADEVVPNSNGQNPDQKQEAKEDAWAELQDRLRDLTRLLSPGGYRQLEPSLYRGDPDAATLRARVENAIAQAKKSRR